MTKEEYIILYQRYLSGIATPNEIELLFSYKDKFDLVQFDNDDILPNQDVIRDRIYGLIDKKIPKYPFRQSLVWLSIAASVFVLLFSGLYAIRNHSDKHKNQLALSVKPAIIVPGTNKAILILGNGKKIDLNQTTNGQISQSGKIRITKVKNGQLKYTDSDIINIKAADISYNTIITPKGGQYQIILPDGTSVWLNAASSLRYPTKFTEKERHVELNGEAYFEVAKNKDRPFTIAAGKVNIKVLGTHFNVAAYDDDPSTKTTLLEGSVILNEDNQQVKLVPGQQAIAKRNGEQIDLKTVNVEDAIAWKNGYFSFRKENMESVMRKIARWYDVQVVYQGKVNNKVLGGSVSRTQNIDQLLAYLQLTGVAQFKIEGRRIMVKAN